MNPRVLTLYGPPKVGKTTILSQLEDCLIIDTEEGTSKISALKVEITSIPELAEVIKQLREKKHQYKYIALDTIDNIAIWYEAIVCKENKVKQIGDMPFGAGYNVVRERVINVIGYLKQLAPHVIIVGHLKRSLIGSETTVMVDASSLDLTGRLKNMIMADSDAIGLVHRSPEGELMISFQGTDSLEVGSRCPHLQNQLMPFQWDKIYV